MTTEAVNLSQPESLQWQVNGLTIAGLAWGDARGRPLLALHGWLDNAASFALLAPLLRGCRVVALDLTGHGRSSHRSADASYQIWDDLPEVCGVLEQLGWQTFDLIGHSRGAIIATLLAASCPGRVRRLVLLDAVSPESVPPAQFPAQMGRALQDKQRLLGAGNRVFPGRTEAVAYRRERGLSEQAAALLAERNLVGCEGGVTWTTDPRLRGASAVKLSAEHAEAVLAALGMPCLLLLAREGARHFPHMAAQARRCIRDIRVAEIDGGHHFHMEPAVADAARLVLEFLQREAEEGGA